jgi:diguanylate cyclase (GGDEF)-like protein
MQYVVDSASTAVCVLDPALSITLANEMARRLLSAEGAGTPVGRCIAEIVPDAVALLARQFEAVIEGRQPAMRRVPWRDRHYHVSFGAMRDPAGAPYALVVMAVDVTRYALIEQRLRSARRRLIAASRQDHLTGLLNRRGLELSLHGELRRCRRDGAPLSVVAIDIDNFKAYNDSWGHPQGDACLRRVSAALMSCLRRSGDTASRYGGEEFILVLPNSPLQGAVTVAEACLRAVADLALDHPASPFGRVTVSIGVAAVQPVGSDEVAAQAADLMSAADRALYRAKRSGRARIEVAGDGS